MKTKLEHQGSTFTITFEPHIFPDRIIGNPGGWLNRHIACHALFRYALTARHAYEQWLEKYEMTLDGEHDPPEVDFKTMILNFANLYGVSPENMVRFWDNVRMQFRSENIPLPPQSAMFNKIPEIWTRRN